jgi:hypothetical protein
MHPTRNLFAEFKGDNRVFIETGSYRGDGIQLALDAGYEKIISIDNDPTAIEFCISRFDLQENKPSGKIYIHHGDSAECLSEILGCFNEPITFWLDSHWQMLDGTNPGKNPFPLKQELKQIEKTGRVDHVILIDDLIYMTDTRLTKYCEDELDSDLKSINPAYNFHYCANPVIRNLLIVYP